MFNLSSLQDQVSNCIVNNAYFGKLVQIKIKIAMLWQKKLSISYITPSPKAVLTVNKNAFQRLKITHYLSMICSNNSV